MCFRVLFIHIIHYIIIRLYNVIKECFFVESNFLCLKPHSVDDDARDDDARDGDARDETARKAVEPTLSRTVASRLSVGPSVGRKTRVP